jgi:ApbE superfamily uncharacterized protein (UPF0280 family)
MSMQRTYRPFTHKNAAFSIYCSCFEAVTAEIRAQRTVLERYLERHPLFGTSFEPVAALEGAPEVALRMARAAACVGVGPMAAVAGTMAQLAAEAGVAAGAPEAIVENGGDIFLTAREPVTVVLYTGQAKVAANLAFEIRPDQTPLAVCSSSGRMGHSTSLGRCDLATVVSRDASLADAAATLAANLVSSPGDIDTAIERVNGIRGVEGVLVATGDRVGLAGDLPRLVRTRGL